MSTEAAMEYDEIKPTTRCAICGHSFTANSTALTSKPPRWVCLWCYSRRDLYLRFTKLIAALENMSAAHGGNADCECSGHKTLYAIRKATS